MKRKITLIALIALLAALAILLTACGNNVEGTWEYLDGTGEFAAAYEQARLFGGVTTFTFKAGVVIIMQTGMGANTKPVEGGYTVENGKIIMSFNGQASKFDYKIEGKKMTLTLSGGGSVINLEKK